MYKNFVKENNIVLVFPKKNTQVSFDGSKYHGEIKLNEISEADDENERLILAINIWKHNPTNVDFYESCLDVSSKIYNKTTTMINISNIHEKYTIDASKKFNESMFNTLAYQNLLKIDNPPEMEFLHFDTKWDRDEITPDFLYHPFKQIEDHEYIRSKLNANK